MTTQGTVPVEPSSAAQQTLPGNTGRAEPAWLSQGQTAEIHPGQAVAGGAQVGTGTQLKKCERSLGQKRTLLRQRGLYKVQVGSDELGPRARIKEKAFPRRSSHEGGKQRMGDRRYTVPEAARP